jgi:hypothetical protein
MQSVKGKGTRLEKRLFAMLAGMGLKGWKRTSRISQVSPMLLLSTNELPCSLMVVFGMVVLIAAESCQKQTAITGRKKSSVMLL